MHPTTATIYSLYKKTTAILSQLYLCVYLCVYQILLDIMSEQHMWLITSCNYSCLICLIIVVYIVVMSILTGVLHWKNPYPF